MKVIHVIARMNQGGTAKWIETLTNGLRDHGNEVILLAGNVESNETEDSSFEKLGGIRIVLFLQLMILDPFSYYETYSN
jgi:hypothetical protein